MKKFRIVAVSLCSYRKGANAFGWHGSVKLVYVAALLPYGLGAGVLHWCPVRGTTAVVQHFGPALPRKPQTSELSAIEEGTDLKILP